ncbi:unnamed protein product [Protopolystoma xenopodis]|uniref:Innexin n=1 Tax=Protopolystoma xenopodis TaxID=117903 RepID=A0A448X2X4_9PLAT|nr:unnamed protein product [Protopolystoma xenopodis]
MVGSEFLDWFNKLQAANRVAIEDFSDRVNIFTVVLFLLSCIVVSAKQYLLNSISCFVPVSPTGNNFQAFVSDFCWVHGTIPLRPDEPIPSTPDDWRTYDLYRRQSESYLTPLNAEFLISSPVHSSTFHSSWFAINHLCILLSLFLSLSLSLNWCQGSTGPIVSFHALLETKCL